MRKRRNPLLKIFLVNSLFLVVGVVCLWLVDIGQINVHFQELFGLPVMMCNGLWCLKPRIIYHLGMYGSILNIFSCVIYNTKIVAEVRF